MAGKALTSAVKAINGFQYSWIRGISGKATTSAVIAAKLDGIPLTNIMAGKTLPFAVKAISGYQYSWSRGISGKASALAVKAAKPAAVKAAKPTVVKAVKPTVRGAKPMVKTAKRMVKAGKTVVKAISTGHEFCWREKLAKYKDEFAKGVYGYWNRGKWTPIGISARNRARIRKQVLLAGEDWPYDPPRGEMRTKRKGHKCDRESAKKRANTVELMKKMPEMLLDYKKRRWAQKMKAEEKAKEG